MIKGLNLWISGSEMIQEELEQMLVSRMNGGT